MKKGIPKIAESITFAPPKVLKPSPHPQQARLEQYRALPSLVTTNPNNSPKGK
jgi:hypothetical protein